MRRALSLPHQSSSDPLHQHNHHHHHDVNGVDESMKGQLDITKHIITTPNNIPLMEMVTCNCDITKLSRRL